MGCVSLNITSADAGLILNDFEFWVDFAHSQA